MSSKPSVATNTVRAPSPSSSALVAAVVPCANSLTSSRAAPRALEHRLDGGEHALGLVLGRRRRLGGHEAAVDGEHGVGEGPAHVHAQQPSGVDA